MFRLERLASLNQSNTCNENPISSRIFKSDILQVNSKMSNLQMTYDEDENQGVKTM